MSPERLRPATVEALSAERGTFIGAATICSQGQFCEVTWSPVLGTPASTNSIGTDWQ